jgi:hypothetical protein
MNGEFDFLPSGQSTFGFICLLEYHMKNVLVMTATITPPNGARSLARTDPDLRRRDYERALEHYLDSLSLGTFDQLVFAENSDGNLESLRTLVFRKGLTKKVDFFSVYGLDYPIEYGRGYGEFLLIDRLMESPLMHSQCLNSIVWKITGRYRVANIEQFVRKCPRQFDLYCNCRNYPGRVTDQYILAWRVGIYLRYLKGVYDHLKENEIMYSEQLMREFIDKSHFDSLCVVPRFTRVPIIQGIRGSDNGDYSAGIKNRGKLFLRQITNRAFPWLWI